MYVHVIYVNNACVIVLYYKGDEKGQMTKKGHLRHTWKMRWFVLTTTDLFYYESKESLVKKVISFLSVHITS